MVKLDDTDPSVVESKLIQRIPLDNVRKMAQKPQNSWARFLIWDGVLPISVAAVPHATKLLYPNNVFADICAIFLVPTFAALVRTMIGANQIREACDGRFPATHSMDAICWPRHTRLRPAKEIAAVDAPAHHKTARFVLASFVVKDGREEA